MASVWQESSRKELLTRLRRLSADTPGRWGKFTCPAMLAHVNDALRMQLGDLTLAPKKMLLRYFPLKQLIIYVLPFPRSAPTAPELLARTARADWGVEVLAFRELITRLGAASGRTEWPPHPAFGAMSRRDWGVLAYRHVAHHFDQFDV